MAGLDSQSRLALLNLITELRGEGHTVLLTTHFIEEADRLCDRVAIMDHGRVLALDTPTTLKRSLGGDTGARSGSCPGQSLAGWCPLLRTRENSYADTGALSGDALYL
jgi:ABC-type multidrug transport system ATPase subunit